MKQKVECIAKEDLCRQEWMHEIVCIKKGQKFAAEYFDGESCVVVTGYGFKDGVEFIPLSKIQIIS